MFPSLLVAAVFFAHSRVALMLGVFAIVRGWIAVLQGRKDTFKQVVIVGMISIILASPWLLRVLWIQYDPYGLRITYPLLNGYNDIQRMEEPVLHFVTNWPVLFSALASAVAVCLSRKRTIGLVLAVWCMALVGGALFSGEISLSFWDLKTTLLSLAIPFAELAGLGVQSLKDMLPNRGWVVIWWLTIVFLIIGIIGAGIWFPRLIYTAHIYLRPGDLIAIEWIKRSLPSNALFVVNTLQFEWNPGWIVGSDAGYWIPLLARRDTLLPPMLYPLEWSAPTLSPRLHQWYIDELLRKQGSIYYFTSTLLPSVPRLPDQAYLKVIYQQDHIRVFEVIR
ncbi:hypothetical protein [Candidatus Hadarchaeum sp.]|uniref:hypothetical protein n=1 Tax=Candidatus Hadarchaeum sp. TaxID=2883567 RepID=UPI00319DE8C0